MKLSEIKKIPTEDIADYYDERLCVVGDYEIRSGRSDMIQLNLNHFDKQIPE